METFIWTPSGIKFLQKTNNNLANDSKKKQMNRTQENWTSTVILIKIGVKHGTQNVYNYLVESTYCKVDLVYLLLDHLKI